MRTNPLPGGVRAFSLGAAWGVPSPPGGLYRWPVAPSVGPGGPALPEDYPAPDHYTPPRMAPLKTAPRPPARSGLPGIPLSLSPARGLTAPGFSMGVRRAGEGDLESPLGRGKTRLSVDETRDLVATLEIVLQPIEGEERALRDHECLREFQAGPFPLAMRLRARASAWLETAQPNALFEVSHGELEILDKSVTCAQSLGRGKKIALAVGGGAAAVGLLMLLV